MPCKGTQIVVWSRIILKMLLRRLQADVRSVIEQLGLIPSDKLT